MNLSNLLLEALPVTGIEAQWLAEIRGLVPGQSITLLEPPAGQHVPFVEAIGTMAILLEHAGVRGERKFAMAKELYAEMRPLLTLFERPVLYEGFEVRTPPECVPFANLLDFFVEKNMVADNVLIFLRQANEETIATPIFQSRYLGEKALGLSELPKLPPPKAMIEFFVGLPDNLADANAHDCEHPPYELLRAWRASIKPIAESLETRLGEGVYYFADPESDIDDDNCHRFLALHCWCSLLPDSTFIQYLCAATKMHDVGALRSALIDPSNYTHPWKMCNPFFDGIEVGPLLIFSFSG